MTRFFLFSLFLLCNLTSASELQQVAYSSVLEQTSAKPSKVLTYGDHAAQFIQYWQPIGNDTDKSIVFIHGGCWMSEYDIAHSQPAAAALATAGYHVWSLEYRRTGETGGGWPTTYTNIEMAMAFLLQHQHIIPENTLIMGHSAGGHLAMLFAMKQPEKIAGVVGLAPITDIALYAQGESGCQQAAKAFMGADFSVNAKIYEQANPSKHKLHPNTWLLFGQADTIVTSPQQQTFATRQTHNTVVNEAGHFDFIHTQTKSWQVILDTLDKAFSQ